KSFTEAPEDVAAYGPLKAGDGRTFTLSVVNVLEDVVIARIDGVADRTAAEALKGLELFVDRAQAGALGENFRVGAVGVRQSLFNIMIARDNCRICPPHQRISLEF
ncbi:MAG: hypothetical protein EB015_20550, partial [Methylocystaceae bacterium]|nr:hypothetical protein [Methylocystaceae bacterium]